VVGTALAHWAMVLINRSLPATVTSLGLLATPVMGVAASALLLGEAISLSLLSAMAMILAGIAIGTISRRGDVTRQRLRSVVGPVRP
jgi:drug/metabolite transporter (DMT)-like permease